MDYFSVIVLIIVTFVFASDKKLKQIEDIQNGNEDNKNNELLRYIDEFNNNKVEIIKIKENEMNYDFMKRIISSKCSEFVAFQNKEVILNKDEYKRLIANYIENDKKMSGFNLIYNYEEEKISLKSIYVDLINYLNIFNRKEFSTYGIVICKKEDFNKDEKTLKKEIISYNCGNIVKINLKKQNITKEKFKNIFVNKLRKTNFSLMLKLLLLVFSGTLITSNMLYSLINIKENISRLIISLVIYYCYSYIIRYIYSPLKKNKTFASFVFPIYFIIYIITTIYAFLSSKVIKKVQAS